MKKLPLVFSGCLLGLAGAGNLIADTWPVLSHLFSLTGLVLWLFFLILHLFNWEETRKELTKPPLLSGMATFPMAGMILSTYVFRVFPAGLPTWLLIVMILASQSFFFFVLTRLPNILKQGFQPAFSALTFPTIITATSLKMAQGILKLPFLDYLVLAETVICLTILFFVLVGYLIWLRKKV